MRRLALAAALLIGLSGCSLTIDPASVPEPGPACTPTGCAGKACGSVDCGITCQPGSGCTGSCVPVCAGKACGASDGCGATCVAGSGCTGATKGHSVQGQLTPGAGSTGNSGGHSVQRGTLGSGAGSSRAPAGHSISQGTLSP